MGTAGQLRTVLALLLIASAALAEPLPPVPVPAENPLTEARRVLGKILFWDEQLSANDTVACGTCHRPEAGGADPRWAVHPGRQPGTGDDVHGSPGIVALDRAGRPVEHPLFGTGPQVTARTAPSIMGALWSDALFWDGRAGSQFRDPLSGAVAIAAGGALESQVLETLANPAEMARPGHSWPAFADKLAGAAPLALASALPPDVKRAIRQYRDYPALFAAAFGDPAITPVRVAFAIAGYERTLVPDRTPWDDYMAGRRDALDASERAGWAAFQSLQCTQCHVPPLFTNNAYFNVGLQPVIRDAGRAAVTGDAAHRGEMRVPSLRNVGLRRRLMHSGEFASLVEAVSFYNNPPATAERDLLPNGAAYNFSLDTLTQLDVRNFLQRGLTDPRVVNETPPFDRPRLRSETAADSH